MKKEKWSDYASYLVLSDKSGNKLGCTFVSYLNFKKVKEILSIEFVCIHDSIYSCLKDFVSVETMKRLKF